MFSHFGYSVVLTRVIAIGHSWGMLKLNLVETKPWWFSGLFTSISLVTRVVAWLIVVLKLADDSDIAHIIISDCSESEGRQMKVPFCRNHGCFGGPWFLWKWTNLCTAKTCLDLATLWYIENRDKYSWQKYPVLYSLGSQAGVVDINHAFHLY